MVTIGWCVAMAFVPPLSVWVITHLCTLSPMSGRYTSRSKTWCSPLSPTIERLGLDLHRLAIDYARTEHANQPGLANRLRATSIAYDDVLLAACNALEVPAPERRAYELLQPIERLTVEAELARAGLNW